MRSLLEHAQARPVEQAGHEPWHAFELLEHRAHLVPGQDDRRAPGADDAVEPRQVDLQHVVVEEQERAESLVLGGRGDRPSTAREVRKPVTSGAPVPPGDACRGKGHTVEPRRRRPLRAAAIAPESQGLPHPVEEARLRGLSGSGF
jgi:hypothetical protein